MDIVTRSWHCYYWKKLHMLDWLKPMTVDNNDHCHHSMFIMQDVIAWSQCQHYNYVTTSNTCISCPWTLQLSVCPRDGLFVPHTHLNECQKGYHLRHRCRLGIRGTHLKSSIQDIVDEVAPIKKSPPMRLRQGYRSTKNMLYLFQESFTYIQIFCTSKVFRIFWWWVFTSTKKICKYV